MYTFFILYLNILTYIFLNSKLIVGDYMKKQFFYVELKKENGEEAVWIPEHGLTVEPYVLTRYLREGIRNQEISGGFGVIEEDYTKYTFNAKNINETMPDHYFVVKISNQIIKEGSPTANIIKSMSERSVKKTRKNMTRLIAGATASFILITSAAYFVAKDLKNLNSTVKEYERKASIAQEYMKNHKLTDEEKSQMDFQYYEDLRIRAENGDEEAIKEYSIYLAEQQLKEQIEEEKSKTR